MADAFDEVSSPVGAADPFDEVSAPALNVGELSRPLPNAPHGIFNAIWSGMQGSASGLLARGAYADYSGAPLQSALPSQTLPEDATVAEHVAAGAAGIVADLPQILFGVAGGAAGGTAAAGPVGTVAGGAVGGFAVPAAMRAYLVQAYSTGGVRSFGDLWEATKAFAGGAAEGATLGLATAVPGVKAAQIASVPLRAVAVPLAEASGMTAAAAALQERMPTWEEFQVNALLIGGFRSVPAVAKKLGEIYAKTGVEPAQVALEAKADAVLSSEIRNPAHEGVPSKYRDLAAQENAKLAVPDPLPAGARAKAVELIQAPFAEIPQSEKALPTDVNYNYYNSTADGAGITARLSELYKEKILSERRGVVTWEEQNVAVRQELAKTLGTAAWRVPTKKGIPQEELAVELRVRLHMARQMAEQLAVKGKALAAAGENASEAQIADMVTATHRAGLLTADFMGLRAEVARAQNSLKDTTRADINLDKLSEMIDASNGREGVLELARALADADSPGSALRTARLASRTMFQNTIEIWKAGTLSGPQTFEANILGNLHLLGEIPKRALTAQVGNVFEVVGRAYAKMAGKEYVPESQASTHETVAMARSLIGGSLDGLKLAGAVIQSREKELLAKVDLEARRLASIRAVGEGAAAGTAEFSARVQELTTTPDAALTEGVRAFAIKARASAEKLEHAVPAKVGSKLYWAQTPFRVLSATDALFRAVAEQMEAHALATRDALREGLEYGTTAFESRVSEILLDPSVERAAEITAAGHRGVFTTKLGKHGRYLQLLVQDTPLEFILPYIKTPINLMKRSADYLPGINFLRVADRAAMREGGAARDEVVSRLIIGSAIVVAGSAAVAAGTMTGGGFHLDKQARAARKAAGKPNYAIKINGKWYEYGRIQPAASVLSAVADYNELASGAGNLKPLELAGATVAAVSNALVSQQYLQGTANAINALTDPARYGGRFFDQYAASLVPSLFGQVAAAMDPHAREINSTFDAIKARIPVWREELYPTRNPLTGEPFVVQKAWLFSPIKVTPESTDKILLEAARLEVPISSAPRSVHIGAGTGKIGKVDIEDKNRNEFIRIQGEFAHEILDHFVNDPSWDKRSDFVKKAIYAEVLKGARMKASLAALPVEARRWEAARIAVEVGLALEK